VSREHYVKKTENAAYFVPPGTVGDLIDWFTARVNTDASVLMFDISMALDITPGERGDNLPELWTISPLIKTSAVKRKSHIGSKIRHSSSKSDLDRWHCERVVTSRVCPIHGYVLLCEVNIEPCSQFDSTKPLLNQ